MKVQKIKCLLCEKRCRGSELIVNPLKYQQVRDSTIALHMEFTFHRIEIKTLVALRCKRRVRFPKRVENLRTEAMVNRQQLKCCGRIIIKLYSALVKANVSEALEWWKSS